MGQAQAVAQLDEGKGSSHRRNVIQDDPHNFHLVTRLF